MANFEYYLELYSRNKRELYRDAYQSAYRELMTEYENQVRVQEMLLEQLGVDAKRTRKLSDSVSKADKDKKSKQVDTAGKINKAEMDKQADNNKARINAKKEVEKEYSIDEYKRDIAKISAEIGVRADISDKNRLEQRLQTLMSIMTPIQQEVFVATELQGIVDKFNGMESVRQKSSPPYVAQLITKTELAGMLGVPSRTPEDIEKEKKEKEDERYIPVTGDPEMVAFQRKFVREGNEAGLNISQNKDGSFEVGSMFEGIDVTAPKAPTEQEILARAAELYAPTGSRKFQKSMEELAAEREAKKVADKKAKQEMVASMPSWGGQALKVAPRAEELSGKDDNELLESDDTGIQLGIQTHRSQQFEDIGDAISYINSQAKDDAQKSSALSAYLSRQYRQYRTTQEDSLENLLGDE
jgi:hypothetical protein